MKPYDDENCRCHKVEAEINEEFPDADWNVDAACKAWRKRSKKLFVNNIEYDPHSDAYYGCTCPTCGRLVCGWCI